MNIMAKASVKLDNISKLHLKIDPDNDTKRNIRCSFRVSIIWSELNFYCELLKRTQVRSRSNARPSFMSFRLFWPFCLFLPQTFLPTPSKVSRHLCACWLCVSQTTVIVTNTNLSAPQSTRFSSENQQQHRKKENPIGAWIFFLDTK